MRILICPDFFLFSLFHISSSISQWKTEFNDGADLGREWENDLGIDFYFLSLLFLPISLSHFASPYFKNYVLNFLKIIVIIIWPSSRSSLFLNIMYLFDLCAEHLPTGRVLQTSSFQTQSGPSSAANPSFQNPISGHYQTFFSRCLSHLHLLLVFLDIFPLSNLVCKL